MFKKVCDFLSPHIFEYVNNNKLPIFSTLSNEQLSFFENTLSKIKIDNYSNSECPPSYLATLSMLISEITKGGLSPEQSGSDWVKRLVNVLSTVQHFQQPLNELIKKHCHYELSYMCKAFKKYTGTTMSQYFNTMKLSYARTLLVSTDYTTSKIAELAGFNNLSHFFREFKKKYSITPLQFRNSAR